MYCNNKACFIKAHPTCGPHVDDRRGHGQPLDESDRERGPVSVLCEVSKQWRAGLKKHIAVLRAEIARYEAHRVFLKETRDKVYNLRVSHFGEPYRSDY